MTNLKTAVESILDRQGAYNLADAYYTGSVGEVYASAWYARTFGQKNSNYSVNMAATVVDAVNNRLEIDAILGTTQAATSKINTILEQNEMALEANEIHKKALVYGECYVIVWPGDDGEVEISYNSPTHTALVYSNENQRKKEYGVKMWVEDTPLGSKRTRVNLYFADRIEKYAADGEYLTGGANFFKIDEVENAWGEVPVFHFRTGRPYGTPEHFRAYEPQNMINKLVSIHMETIDYQGAPQRWALTGAADDAEANAFEDDDTDRENIGALRNGPGELWYLKGVTKVGQFEAADHKTFTEPIAVYTRAMASSTDTPMHYFERTGNVPSGEALRTAEAPLLKKVQDRQVSFGSTWRDVYRFALKIEGVKADVQIKWKPMESMDSKDAWETASLKKLVGVSPYQIFKEQGYDEEIALQMAAEVNEKVAAAAQPGMNAHNILAQESPATTDAGAN